jgi:hypothetical protein
MNINTQDVLKKLSGRDKKEIKNAFGAKDFTLFPRLGADSKILPSQWKTWQVLQRQGLGYINGDYESGEFKLNEAGKQVAGEIK